MKSFTVGSRKHGLWNATIDEKSLIADAKKGITETLTQILTDTQTSIGSNGPGTYRDRSGLLSDLLEKTGLDEKLNPGELKEAWQANIANMKVKNYKEKSEFVILDIGLLNRTTEWYGVQSKPKVSKQKVTLEHYVTGARMREIVIKGETGGVVNSDDALRPLPSNDHHGFVFMRNPYPGYGYWKLYHDGYTGYNISYAPRPFIRYAFNFMFGATSTFLTGNTDKVTYTENFKNKTATMLATNINKYWGGQ